MSGKIQKHWLIVVLLCGLAASSIGVCSNCVGIFYTPVSDDLGILRGSFAMHATLSSLATAAMAFLTPKLMAVIPYKRLLFFGAALATLSTVGMAFSRQLWLFFVLGILRGVGAGLFANVPVSIILTNWFHQKHGIASGITLSFSGLSGAICSPLLAQCITTFGWSTSYLVMAAIILLLTIPALVYPFTVRPQDMGLTPYGGERVQPVQKSDFDAMFLYKKVSFICLCVMTVLHTSIAGIAQHFTGFATSIEFTVEIGAFMMSLSMVGNIVTKLLIGVLSDKIGPVKSCVVMILLNAFSMLLFLLGSGSGSVAVLYVASFCYGSVYSVGAVGFSLLSKHFFGEKYFSKAYAVIGLLTYVGSALSLPLIGYLYDFTGSYQGMFLVTLGIHAVNLVLLTVIVKSYKKDYHTAK